MIRATHGKATALFVLALALLCGCGPTLVYSEVKSASRQLERAEFMGAPDFAPYVYFQAIEFLKKARLEMAEGNYGDAQLLAQAAQQQALLAVSLTQKVKPREKRP